MKLKYVSAGEASVSAGEALRAGFQKASGEEACVCGTSFGEPSTFQGVENQWQKGLLDRAGDQFQSLLSSNYGAQTSGGISGGEALTSSERIAYDFFLKTAQGQQALKAASGSSIVSPRALEDASDALLKKFPVPKGRLPGTWQDGEASNRVVTELYGDRIGSEVLDAHARELSSPDVLEAVGDMQFRKITTPQYKMTGQLDLYGQPVPERVFDPVTLQWKYVRDPHPLMSYESHDISAREAGEYQYDPNDPSKFETKSDDKGITRTTQKRNVFMLDPNDDISPADSMQVKNEKIRRRRLMVLRKLAFEHATSRVDHTEDQQLALEALRLKNALRSKKLSIEERKEMAGELSMIRFQLEGSPVFTDGGSTSVEQILDQDSPSEADLSARRNAIIAEARSPAVDLESQLQLGRTLKARHNIEEAFMRSAPDDLRKAYTAARTCEIERFGSGRPSGGLEGSPETRVAKPAH